MYMDPQGLTAFEPGEVYHQEGKVQRSALGLATRQVLTPKLNPHAYLEYIGFRV